LDGKTDAITRATDAAANLIADKQRYGSGSTTLSGPSDYSLVFHSTLPASDGTALGANTTTDPVQAAFAEVVATPRTVQMVFLNATNALLGNAASTAQVDARAVAGFTQEACDITPLMFCLPSPTYTAKAHIGDMIKLRGGGQGAAWGPGDFGFLDPTKADLGATCAGLNGAKLIGCLVGAELNVTQCFTQRGVDIEPGQKVGIEDAIFNVRFDIYKSTMNGKKNDPNYPPAPNVVSGIMPQGGGSCIGQQDQISPDTMALPKDTCIISGACGRIGDGNWDRGTYIDRNHGDNNGTFDAGEDSHLTQYSIAGGLYAGTRYELYNQEIQFGDSGSLPANNILNRTWETGRHQCSPHQSIRPERRVVIAAGIDCAANPINGAKKNVPVEEFFEMFLTEPVGDDGLSPPTLDLMVEIIGSAGGDGYGAAGAGGIFRDVVQLYR
jgi:hypothetical protein